MAGSARALARVRPERLAGAGGRRRGRLIVGAALVGLFAASALLAPWLAPYDPAAVPAALSETMLRPPEAAHLLGTDALGRDLLSRVLYGGRVSLALGLGVGFLVSLAVHVLNTRDLSFLKQPQVLVFAVIYVMANLVVDLAYLVIDPRIRRGR